MMNEGLIISFCNTLTSLELEKRGYSNLGLLDYPNQTIYWIKLPKEVICHGITGLSQNKDYLFAACQAIKPGIIIFEKNGLRIKSFTEIPELKDPHSLLTDNRFLYVVSTGTDTVYRYRLNKKGEINLYSKEIFWRPKKSKGQADTHHLNSICKHNGEILVSAFGPKRGQKWITAQNGYVYSCSTNKKIFTRIFHPHSLFSDTKKALLFCESATKSVKKNGKSLVKFSVGYTRGLTEIDNYLIVGLSSGRRVSKSTGIINNIADPGELVLSNNVIFLNKKMMFLYKICKVAYSIMGVFLFSFDRFHREIYDILSLDSFFIQENCIIGKNYLKKERIAKILV